MGQSYRALLARNAFGAAAVRVNHSGRLQRARMYLGRSTRREVGQCPGLAFLDEVAHLIVRCNRRIKAAERTRDGLRQLIGQALGRFQPQENGNFFKNAYAI
jgi:hypothetical protein